MLEPSQGERDLFVCSICDKVYKREASFKTHMKKIHGVDDGKDDGSDVFDPQATSTAEDFRDKSGERAMSNSKKKSQSRSTTDGGDGDVENLEEARKAKESRQELRERLNMERAIQLGYDDDFDDQVDSLALDQPGPSTQQVNDGLAQALADHETTYTSPSMYMTENDSGHRTIDISALTSGRDQAITDMDVRIMQQETEIKTLKTTLANKESHNVDLQITISEINDQLDAKDRQMKEMREILRMKNEEIKDLVEEAKNFNEKLKKSPLKEELKANSKKAEAKIQQLASRVKHLEAQLKKDNKPELEKLKLQVNDQLRRAEHYMREEIKHLNTIAALRKKIPCGDLPNCDQGKKCAYSHSHKYVKKEESFKHIPCVHYMHGRCRFINEEDCKFAHPREAKNVTWDVEINGPAPRRRVESVSSARSESGQDAPRRSSMIKRTVESRPSGSSKPPAKRSKLVPDYSSTDNSCATDKFPSPVPAYTSRARSASRGRKTSNNNSNVKVQGNANGAQGRRSPLVAPRSTRGSRRSRSKSQPRYRSYSHHQQAYPARQRKRSTSRTPGRSFDTFNSPNQRRHSHVSRPRSHDFWGQGKLSREMERGRQSKW